MKVLTLTNEQVLSLADMSSAVEEVRKAFLEVEEGRVESPVRTRFRMSDVRNVLLMPSLIRGPSSTVSLKIVSVYPDLGGSAPSTKAVVLLVDGKDGEVKCMMGGTSLTALRTGAVSGLSCKYLARKDSRNMAMIGAGGQGFFQVSGIVSQLGIKRVSVFDVDKGRQKRLMERCEKELHLEATASDSIRAATSDADVVGVATTSKTPVMDSDDVRSGTHIVAIGAYTPESRELGTKLVARSSLFVDSKEAAMEEAGDILIPIKEGAVTAAHIRGDLAGLASGKVKGRSADSETTIFKAVGLAVEDNVVGWMVFNRALASGVGSWTEL